MRWRDQRKTVREVDVDLLDLVGGVTPTAWDVWGVRFLNTDTVVKATESTPGWNQAEEDVEETEAVQADALQPSSLSIPERLEDDTDPTPMARHPKDAIAEQFSGGVSSADTRSISSLTSTRSHLTPNLPRPTADKRRSMRLARRSSGGETAMPTFEYLERSYENTPTNDRPVPGLA